MHEIALEQGRKFIALYYFNFQSSVLPHSLTNDFLCNEGNVVTKSNFANKNINGSALKYPKSGTKNSFYSPSDLNLKEI